jgi:hypothetical protein
VFYSCDNNVFSVPVVFRSKAQYKGNGYSLDNCSCVVLLSSIRPTWTWEVRKVQGAIFCHGHIAVNIDKLTEHAIITGIEH